MTGGHGRFPIAAFLQFPIAGDDEDAIGSLVDLSRNGDAYGDRHTVAEWARVGLDAGHVIAVGMTIQRRERSHVGLQRFPFDEAGFSQRRVKGAARVPLAQDQPVAVRRPRVRGIDLHHAEVERRENIDNGHVAARMSLSGLVDHGDSRAADRKRFVADSSGGDFEAF